MKKIKKIRILKDKQDNSGNYTFLEDKNTLILSNSKEMPKDGALKDLNSKRVFEEKHKKLSRKEPIQSNSRGLKYINPSQRNHSSVYE